MKNTARRAVAVALTAAMSLEFMTFSSFAETTDTYQEKVNFTNTPPAALTDGINGGSHTITEDEAAPSADTVSGDEEEEYTTVQIPMMYSPANVTIAKWVKGTDIGSDNYSFDGLYNNFVFCRVNPVNENADDKWTAVWNQTEDLPKEQNFNYYVLNQYYDKNYKSYMRGYWSNYDQAQSDDMIFLCTAQSGQDSFSGASMYAYTWDNNVNLTEVPAVEATYVHGTGEVPGHTAYYTCESYPGKYFLYDSTKGYYEVSEDDLVVYYSGSAHTLTHHPAVAATTSAPGNIEYWTCDECEKYFSDAQGTHEITQAETVIPVLQNVTVTFNSNGGSAVASQTIERGSAPAVPDVPTREGYTFMYWCSDEQLNTEFNFETAVTTDTTLYAKWYEDWEKFAADMEAGGTVTLTKDIINVSGGSKLPITLNHDVTLDMNGHTVNANGSANNLIHAQTGTKVVINGTGTFTGVAATIAEGGVLYVAGNADVTLNSVTITGNTARNGGAIYYYRGALTLNNCTITNNTAFSGGGGIFSNNSSSLLSNNLFLKGTTYIWDNKLGNNQSNIYTVDSTANKIEARDINADSKIGVSTSVAPTDQQAVSVARISSSGTKDVFVSDAGYSVGKYGGVVLLYTNTVNVTFDHGEGSGDMDGITAYSGYSVKLPDCTFTAPEGKVFSGWLIGETVYQAHDSYNFTADTVVTAQWEYLRDITDSTLATFTSETELKYEYTGNPIYPFITLTYQGHELEENTDYELTGDTSATEPGNYTMTITGKGLYTGAIVVPWSISRQFTVIYDDGTGVKNKQYPQGQVVIILAVSRPGEYFAYWADENNVPVSYNEKYSFVVLSDVDVHAVYAASAAERQSVLTIGALQAVFNEKNAIRFRFNRSVSPDYSEVKRAGIIYGTNKLLMGSSFNDIENDPTLNLFNYAAYGETEEARKEYVRNLLVKDNSGARTFEYQTGKFNGTIDFTYAVGNYTNAYVYAVAFVEVVNSNNVQEMLYSDVIAVTRDTL